MARTPLRRWPSFPQRLIGERILSPEIRKAAGLAIGRLLLFSRRTRYSERACIRAITCTIASGPIAVSPLKG